MESIPKNIKVTLMGFLPLVGLIFLSIFAFQFGLGKISDVRAKVTQARQDENVLQSKLSLLNEVQSTISTSSNMATVALPSENPVLTVLTQLKALASQDGISLENFKSGAETKDTSGLSRVDSTFDVSGARPQIFEFLSSISKIAPISAIDKFKLTESGGSGRATVIVKSFWADLPATLPPINQGISDLTPDEKKVLTDISNLIQPTFSQITPGEGSGKTDPFSF